MGKVVKVKGVKVKVHGHAHHGAKAGKLNLSSIKLRRGRKK